MPANRHPAPNRPPRTTRLPGFTLMEIMVVMTIMSFVFVGLAAFSISSTRSIFWATQKSNISREVRLFTMGISRETLNANVAFLYPSFAPGHRNGVTDRLQSGESGDCLVLVSKSPYPNMNDPYHYTNLTIYFVKADEGDEGSLYRAEVTFTTPVEIDADADPDHFESFLATQFPSENVDASTVLDQVRGLADGGIFQKRQNNMIVVTCEILHGHEVKEVTNTYNLTLSTGG